MNSMRRVDGLRAVLGFALAVSLLPGCSAAESVVGRHHVSVLDDVPSFATRVTYTDDTSVESRLHLSDVTAVSTVARLQRYSTLVEQQAPWATNPLTTQLVASHGHGWSPADVDWTLDIEANQPSTVYGLRADLDINTVQRDLRRRRYHVTMHPGWLGYDTAGMSVSARQRLPFVTGAVVPDKHLLVTGPGTSATVSTILGKSDALSDVGHADALQTALHGAEYAVLLNGSSRCGLDRAQVVGGGAKRRTAVRAQVHLVDALGRPVASGLTVQAGDHGFITTVRLTFGSGQAASRDATARTAYLRQGRSLVSNQPFDGLFAVSDVGTDSSTETYTVSGAQIPRSLPSMLGQEDFPFTSCGQR